VAYGVRRVSNGFFSFNTSTTTSQTTGFYGGTTFRVVINAPMLAPPKCPDQLWIEKVTGVVYRGPIEPRECARVRRAFETLEFSPEHRWDAGLARKRYRAMARRLHPDVGGDSDAFKALSNAWDTLKRRGFCG
jgi:hypothetical protein